MDLALASAVAFNRDFDTLLSALALAVSVGGLVPVFIIKEDRRKELTIAFVVTLLIALTATMVVRNREHASEVHEIQNEIVATLSGNRWTSDQLYKQLHFPRREAFFEALFGAVEQRRIQQGVVQVRIDDSLPVDVRLYWVDPAKTQAGETGSPNLCPSPGSQATPTRASLRSPMDAAWQRRGGMPSAPWPLFSAVAVIAFGLRRKTEVR